MNLSSRTDCQCKDARGLKGVGGAPKPSTVPANDTASAVAIEILHGKQALPDRTVAQTVLAGEIEMAAANVVTLAGRVKGVDVLSLPFLFNSHALLRAMLDRSRQSRRLLDDAILETGTRVLMWQPCCNQAPDRDGVGYKPF